MPSIATLDTLLLDASVTVLVGENGTGKSTLLEGLAIACRLPAVGSSRMESDHTLSAQRDFAAQLHLTWRGRSHRGFFLRAEDIFGFQRQITCHPDDQAQPAPGSPIREKRVRPSTKLAT